eukprot:g66718.t1
MQVGGKQPTPAASPLPLSPDTSPVSSPFQERRGRRHAYAQTGADSPGLVQSKPSRQLKSSLKKSPAKQPALSSSPVKLALSSSPPVAAASSLPPPAKPPVSASPVATRSVAGNHANSASPAPLAAAKTTPVSSRRQGKQVTPRFSPATFPSVAEEEKEEEEEVVGKDQRSQKQAAEGGGTAEEQQEGGGAAEEPAAALSFDDVGDQEMDGEEGGEVAAAEEQAKQTATESEGEWKTKRAARRELKGKMQNETKRLVKHAQDVNMQDLRRGTRKRILPLRHWAGERQLFKRYATEIGEVLPIVDQIVRQPESPAPPPKKHKATSKSKKRKDEEGLGGELDLEEGARKRSRVLPDTCEVLDIHGQSTYRQPLARSIYSLPFQSLPSHHENDPRALIKAVYALQGPEKEHWFSGFLVLPPGGKKPDEMVERTEVFYIINGDEEALHCKVHETDLHLSKGDVFQIPQGNIYSLHNLSKTKSVKLYSLHNLSKTQSLKLSMCVCYSLHNLSKTKSVKLFFVIVTALQHETGAEAEAEDEVEEQETETENETGGSSSKAKTSTSETKPKKNKQKTKKKKEQGSKAEKMGKKEKK